MTGRAFVGTCGWNYDAWWEPFYEGRPPRQWLSFCAGKFTAIEVDATFYRLQTAETFRRWRDETPARFRFSIKANRFLTHNKKLKDPLPVIRLERDRAAGLGAKLAVVLWQLPRNFQRNLERLEGFARALRAWRRPRHAIEFRHRSWFDEEVAACLRRHHIAVCQSDAADWPFWDAVTTDLVYVRLHGHEATYSSSYSERALRGWARKVRRWRLEGRDVYVYFDNDAFGHAPGNALRLMELVSAGPGARATNTVRAGEGERGKIRESARA